MVLERRRKESPIKVISILKGCYRNNGENTGLIVSYSIEHALEIIKKIPVDSALQSLIDNRLYIQCNSIRDSS